MSRRQSRDAAFKFLYQLEIHNSDIEIQKKLFLDEFVSKEKLERDFFDLIVNGVILHKESLDGIYSPHLNKWELSRIPKIDQTILRIAIYELKYINNVPKNVAISEAILLAKKYSTDEARAYINGILGRISKNLSADGSTEDTAEDNAEDTVDNKK